MRREHSSAVRIGAASNHPEPFALTRPVPQARLSRFTRFDSSAYYADVDRLRGDEAGAPAAGELDEVVLSLGRVDDHLRHASNGFCAFDVHRFVLVAQFLERFEQVVAQVLDLVFHG